MKNSEIFEKAAKIVMRRGHCKGSFGEKNGPVCLVGAVYSAVTGDPDAHNQETLTVADLIDVWWRESGNSGFASTNWNDAPDTTADEVVQVLQFMALSEKDAGR